MRNKLMLSAALTCLVGGSALLAPASGQRRYPSCQAMVYSDCAGPEQTQICADVHGTLATLICTDYYVWEVYSPH